MCSLTVAFTDSQPTNPIYSVGDPNAFMEGAFFSHARDVPSVRVANFVIQREIMFALSRLFLSQNLNLNIKTYQNPLKTNFIYDN